MKIILLIVLYDTVKVGGDGGGGAEMSIVRSMRLGISDVDSTGRISM